MSTKNLFPVRLFIFVPYSMKVIEFLLSSSNIEAVYSFLASLSPISYSLFSNVNYTLGIAPMRH